MRLKASFWRITIQIIVIIVIATIGFQFIYAYNPFQELFALLMMPMSPPVLNAPAPEITGIASWLNLPDNKPIRLADLRGRVVLIDFWTYSCINCKRSVPFVAAWDRKYRDQGLVVIGIHTPEFQFEKKLENVQAAIKDYGGDYPVALDNDYATWRAYHNQYWPALYLIDKQGTVVYRHFGEGAYDITEQKIQALLAAPYQP